MDALPAAEQERVGDRFGDIAGVGWRELLVLVGHEAYWKQTENQRKRR